MVYVPAKFHNSCNRVKCFQNHNLQELHILRVCVPVSGVNDTQQLDQVVKTIGTSEHLLVHLLYF